MSTSDVPSLLNEVRGMSFARTDALGLSMSRAFEPMKTKGGSSALAVLPSEHSFQGYQMDAKILQLDKARETH